MVRPILEGRKTQTRRVVKLPKSAIAKIDPPDHYVIWQQSAREGHLLPSFEVLHWSNDRVESIPILCPYGQAGDSLWVKETYLDFIPEHRPPRYVYRADVVDSESEKIRQEYGYKWKPSIFMPRLASRITLPILKIRVEQLQDISEDDAIAEGIERKIIDQAVFCRDYSTQSHWFNNWADTPGAAYIAKASFSTLWDLINGKTYPWESDPWVWIIEFPSLEKRTK